MKTPLLVEIIAYAPTVYYQCTHCEVGLNQIGVRNNLHEEQVVNSLPADLALEYRAISDWVQDIIHQYCNLVVIKIIDAASLEGFFKSLRYGVHRYPTVIIGQKSRFTGTRFEGATTEIRRFFQTNIPS